MLKAAKAKESLIPAEAVKEAVSVAVRKLYGLPLRDPMVEGLSAAWVACVEAEKRYEPGKGTLRQYFWRVAYQAAVFHLRQDLVAGIGTRKNLPRGAMPEDQEVEPLADLVLALREKMERLEEVVKIQALAHRRAKPIPQDVVVRLWVQWKAGVSITEVAADPECTISPTQLFHRFKEIDEQL